MASEIKILRKFLSMDYNLGTISFDDRPSDGLRYYSSLTFRSLYFKRNKNHHHILYLSKKNNLYLINGLMIKISKQDFLELDDMSLVLKYGRDILDENIFKKYNEKNNKGDAYPRHNISLSTFDDFLNSGE